MPKTQAVAAIICRDSRFLLGRRSPHKKLAPGWWSPISGGIEPGETPAQAVERECREEIGVRAQAARPVAELDIQGGAIRLYFWLVNILAGEPHLNNDENSELRWFSIAEMKTTPNLFTEDIAIFERFLREEI